MQLVRTGKTARVRLAKDLVRNVKRGHAWLYSHAVNISGQWPSGTVATLMDRNDTPIAGGIIDLDHPIPFRVCTLDPPFAVDDAWLHGRLTVALRLREHYARESTTGVRLVAGEGDSTPGLIVDLYDATAVIKLDGGAPESFYSPTGIANWLKKHAAVERVVLRQRGRGRAGDTILGTEPAHPITFQENGLYFSADVLRGQKTGFFLDQRDNRYIIRQLSDGRSVLNLFSYSGGFSIAAGVGGASHVTSVDSAPAAIDDANKHWLMNSLAPERHEGIVADCFEYLQESASNDRQWDITVCDPPSLAPNEKSRPQALNAYARLAQQSARVTRPAGLVALASCSSHVDHDSFLRACFDGIGKARRKATLLADRGLPLDHPTPMAMPELRYLKFLLLQLDS